MMFSYTTTQEARGGGGGGKGIEQERARQYAEIGK